MSYYLIIDKFERDIKKISLTRYLSKSRKLDYSDAKRDVDKIIEGNPIAYKFKTRDELEIFREAILKYGVSMNDLIAKVKPVKRGSSKSSSIS